MAVVQLSLFDLDNQIANLPTEARVAPMDYIEAMEKAAEDAWLAVEWGDSDEDEEGYLDMLVREFEEREAWANEVRYGRVRG